MIQNPILRSHEIENNPAHVEVIKAAMRLAPDVILIGEVRNKSSTKRLVRLAQNGRQFVKVQ